MEFVRDDNFDDTLSTWFCMMIASLDGIMEDCGLSDPSRRRSIATQFMSTLGTSLEQGWFEVEGERRYPLLCFLEGPLPGQAESGSAQRAFIPKSQPFSFSEYAVSNCFHVFEENPNVLSDIRHGVIGEEPPPPTELGDMSSKRKRRRKGT